MSIWGPSPVENDDAADWLGEFSEEPSIGALGEAFNEVLNADPNDYIEIPECSVSIVAAAIVRDLFESERSEYFLDEEILATLRSLLNKLSPAARVNLVAKALKTVKITFLETERSEISQMMQESQIINIAWLKNMNQLVRDLDEIRKSLK